MNITVLSGRIVADPKFSISTAGTECAFGTIAVYRMKDVTDFIPFVFFGERAKMFAESVRKGNLIVVQGRLNMYTRESDAVSQIKLLVHEWVNTTGTVKKDYEPMEMETPITQDTDREPSDWEVVNTADLPF